MDNFRWRKRAEAAAVDRVICAKCGRERDRKTASLDSVKPWDEPGGVFGVAKRCLEGVLVVLLLSPMKCRRGIISDEAHPNCQIAFGGRKAGGAVWLPLPHARIG